MSDSRQSEPEHFPRILHDVPALTAAQMAEVDRLAVDEYGIELLQMMENAGGGLARVIRSLWPDRPRVTILAGGGGNGGGAMAAARRLSGFGMQVSVVLDRPATELRGAAAHQATTLHAMDVRFEPEPDHDPGAIVVDGLIGYGLNRGPRGRAAELIRWAATATSVVSLDVPSGVDATTGHRYDPHVVPDITVTLALPKTGLSPDTAGRLFLADIGIPSDLFRRHLDVDNASTFMPGDIVDVTAASMLRSA